MTGRDPAWDDAVRRAVEASCAAQGVPVAIEDETVLDRVARVLGDGREVPNIAGQERAS